MADFGLSLPYIAKYAIAANVESYTGIFKCSNAVSTSIKPNYNEASQYGDNELKQYLKEFKDADVDLEVNTLPIDAASVMFGHTVDSAKKTVTYAASDASNYVGYGVVKKFIDDDGITKYGAVVLPKVKFADPSESYTTKGDSITFANPKVSGKAMPNAAGVWKIAEDFATEAEAEAFIKSKLGSAA